MKLKFVSNMSIKILAFILIYMAALVAKAQDDGGFITPPDAFPSADEKPPGNPFRNGSEGTWRVKRTYVLQVERTQTRANTTDNVNLRVDGTYNVFYPFWNLPDASSGSFWRIENDEQWTFTEQINHYNPFGGFILENVNPLGIYSASLYGFNNALPTAVSANARFREIGVDSFEDYMYGICANRHFSFKNTQGIESKVTDRASHTGRYSLKVAPGETLYMLKNFAPCEQDFRPIVR